MAEVIKVAHEGYSRRNDYPPYALASWDDRKRWTDYLTKINLELDAAISKATGQGQP